MIPQNYVDVDEAAQEDNVFDRRLEDHDDVRTFHQFKYRLDADKPYGQNKLNLHAYMYNK